MKSMGKHINANRGAIVARNADLRAGDSDM